LETTARPLEVCSEGISVMIDNNLDLIVHTVFVVIMLFGIGLIGGACMFFDVIRSKKSIIVSWSELTAKTPPFKQNGFQEIVTSVLLFLCSIYFLFIDGLLLNYMNEIRRYFGM